MVHHLLVVSIALWSAAAAPAWPLDNTRTLVTEGELHVQGDEPKPCQEWYQFTAGAPHCDWRSRIEYPEESGAIEIVGNGAVSKVIFAKRLPGQHCTTTGPTPFNETQCVDAFAEMGKQYNFTGQQPCPAPRSTQTCDLWTFTSPYSVQTYLFLSGTARVVQSSIANPNSGFVSVVTFSKFAVNNESIPASAWQTPSYWKPCSPA
jgi:hypothetical protein